MLSRRTFLQTSSVAAGALACGPGAAPTGPSTSGGPKQGWEREWDELVAAAKKEGKLVTMSVEGGGYRKVADAFHEAFPEIEVEHATILARTWAPKILQERAAGLYNWDVAGPPAITAFGTLWPEKVFDPLRPLLFRPDVLDDKNWQGGLDFGWADDAKQYSFGYTWDLAVNLHINTDLVREDEIKSAKDLANPKWKGKIAMADPRTGGASATPLTIARLKHGPEIVKQLVNDQEPIMFAQSRQIAEAVVRGKVAIAIGTTNRVILDFRQEGLARNIKSPALDDFAYLSSEVMWLMNRAPHPNAAKLYVNWLLSKEGQQIFSKSTERNSRRTDVPPVDQDSTPPEGAAQRFMDPLRQAVYPEVEVTREMTREWLK